MLDSSAHGCSSLLLVFTLLARKMQSLQLTVPEAAVLASGEEASLLLATIPEQIPVDEAVGSPLLSPEVPQTAPEIPTVEQAPAQSDLPGSSQDEAGSAGAMADEWRFC